MGNSGTTEGARGSTLDSHLHFEAYLDFRPVWQGLAGDRLAEFLAALLPPG